MNIQNLAEAISENIPSVRVEFLNEDSFRLNGQTLKIMGDMVLSKKFSFRFSRTKDLLWSLRDYEILLVNDRIIEKIMQAYRQKEYTPKN